MKQTILTVALFIGFLSAAPVHAEGELVLNPSGALFNARNMAPGQSVTKEITATNRSNDKADIYLNVENVRGNRLADALDFTLTDKDTGEVLIGGPGDAFTLKELADEGDVFIERLKGKGSSIYLITLTFDIDAGNRYQSLSTKFDLSFRLTANPAKPGSEPPCRTDHCRDRWEHERDDDSGSHDDDNRWNRVRDVYRRLSEFLQHSWLNPFRD